MILTGAGQIGMAIARRMGYADAGHVDFTDPKFVNFILTALD